MPAPFIHPARRQAGDLPAGRGHDELHELSVLGVRALVSLLDQPGDGALYRAAGFDLLALPVANGCAPSIGQWRESCQFVDAHLAASRPVVVFCAAGLGRTGTLLASYLIHRGEPANAAIARVRGVEPAAIETTRQMSFLYDLEKLPRPLPGAPLPEITPPPSR